MIEQYLHGLKVPEDELTALERSRLLSEGKEADRILCCIDSGETLAPLIGCTLKEYYFSSEKMCALEEYIYEKYQSDGAGISITLRGMAEAMGTKIKYLDYNIAQVETPAISSLEEVDRLEPVDVERDGRLPIILEGLSLVKKKLGDKVPVSGTVTGPFTVAAMLVGAETLLKGMVRHPDQVLQLMEIITENNNRYIQRLLDMGVGVGFADPMSSTSLLRVSQYEKFSLRFFQRNVDYIKSRGGDKEAYQDVSRKAITETVHNVVFCTIALTGIVSALMRARRQTALAHKLYEAVRTNYYRESKQYLHGEIVATGLIAQLQFNRNAETIGRLKEYMEEMEMPMTLQELGLNASEEVIHTLYDRLAASEFVEDTKEDRRRLTEALMEIY